MQPWLTKVAIDEHIARGDLAGVGRVAALFLAVLAGVFVLEFAQTWISQTIGQGIMFEMRMAIYGHLQRVDVAFYDRHAVGRLMTRVTSDVDALNDLFSAGVVAVFGDAFMLAGIIGVVLWMDWRLALVTFSVLPLIVLVTQWFRRHVRESYRRVRGWVARINAFLQENLTGMATVQLFRRETLNFERFEAINRGHRDANVEAIFYYAVFYPAIEAVAALAAALIIVAGGHWVGTGTLTIGALVAFLQYAQRFFRPISDMSEKFNLLQAAMASSERIFALLDTPVTIASPAAPAPRPPGARGHIVFDHVWFAYGVDAATAAAAAADAQVPMSTGCCGTCRSRCRRGSASASSARPAPARRPSSACCCASTTSSAGASSSTASTSASSTSPSCAASAGWCCRTCISSPAASWTTCAWAGRG